MKVLLLAATVLGLGAGCQDDCAGAESSCDGNAVVRCVETDGALGNRWGEGSDCGDAICVEAAKEAPYRLALCASSEQPDSRCPTPVLSPNADFLCVDNTTLLVCRAGYGLEEPCVGRCVTTAGRGACR